MDLADLDLITSCYVTAERLKAQGKLMRALRWCHHDVVFLDGDSDVSVHGPDDLVAALRRLAAETVVAARMEASGAVIEERLRGG